MGAKKVAGELRDCALKDIRRQETQSFEIFVIFRDKKTDFTIINSRAV